MQDPVMSVAEIAASVRAGEQRAVDVVAESARRIAQRNPELNAFVAWDGDAAVTAAAEIDRMVADGRDPGPLAGVPIGVKDLEDAAGFVTTRGSALLADQPSATTDSVLVARLRTAGAVVMGKTNTPEHGHKGVTDNPLFGETRNPWNLAHSPGGSSGGTAAAIASGMVPLATGSDGGGSIRIPAALCGLTALKPENGRIPIAGTAMPGGGLFSVAGPMGRTALDTAIALDAVRGPHPRDPFSLPHQPGSWADAVLEAEPPERVAWCPTQGFADVDPRVLARCRSLVERLGAAGTEVIEVDTIFPTDPAGAWATLWCVGRFKVQGELMGTADWERVSPSLRPLVEYGADVSGVEHARALDALYEHNALVEDVFDRTGASLLLCPTTAGLPPPLTELGDDPQADTAWVQLTYGFNMTRHPAGTVCAGIVDGDRPVGLQVVARHHDEPSALAALGLLEELAPTTTL